MINLIFITSLKTHSFKANAYGQAHMGGLVLNSFPLCFAVLHNAYLLLLHREQVVKQSWDGESACLTVAG